MSSTDTELVPVLIAQAELGESPVWDHRSQHLRWVDITRATVHRFDPATGKDSFIELDSMVGAVALSATGGLIAAAGERVLQLDDRDTPREIARITDGSGVRFNDGNVDA